ncbi:hypothetical protein GQ600_20298 [Phytophthora cactorum]|nr:hypothetical protein GQ600_20298 [Phytophthora cactorum]
MHVPPPRSGEARLVMDKAKYHTKRRPKTSQKKELKARYAGGVQAIRYKSCTGSDTKATMWEKLSRHVELYVQPEIVSLAKAKGHETAFDDISRKTIQGCIDKGRANLLDLSAHIKTQNDLSDADDSPESDKISFLYDCSWSE